MSSLPLMTSLADKRSDTFTGSGMFMSTAGVTQVILPISVSHCRSPCQEKKQYTQHKIQSNPVISNSLISNYRLSRSENLVPVLT